MPFADLLLLGIRTVAPTRRFLIQNYGPGSGGPYTKVFIYKNITGKVTT